jgi:hypothetical protein
MQQIKHFYTMLNATQFDPKWLRIPCFSTDLLTSRPRRSLLLTWPSFNMYYIYSILCDNWKMFSVRPWEYLSGQTVVRLAWVISRLNAQGRMMLRLVFIGFNNF